MNMKMARVSAGGKASASGSGSTRVSGTRVSDGSSSSGGGKSRITGGGNGGNYIQQVEGQDDEDGGDGEADEEQDDDGEEGRVVITADAVVDTNTMSVVVPTDGLADADANGLVDAAAATTGDGARAKAVVGRYDRFLCTTSDLVLQPDDDDINDDKGKGKGNNDDNNEEKEKDNDDKDHEHSNDDNDKEEVGHDTGVDAVDHASDIMDDSQRAKKSNKQLSTQTSQRTKRTRVYEALLVEVKGPTDTLADHQLMWLQMLSVHGVNAVVAHVKEK